MVSLSLIPKSTIPDNPVQHSNSLSTLGLPVPICGTRRAGTLALAQTPGPDLAWQDAVMQSEAFIMSENSCISTSRRARAGWHATT